MSFYRKIKEKHCTSRVTSHRLMIRIPMLMLLFVSTSVSTGGLKKGRADWHFSLLARAVRGERAQPGTAQAKPNRNPEKDLWGQILITAQTKLSPIRVFCPGSSAVIQQEGLNTQHENRIY